MLADVGQVVQPLDRSGPPGSSARSGTPVSRFVRGRGCLLVPVLRSCCGAGVCWCRRCRTAAGRVSACARRCDCGGAERGWGVCLPTWWSCCGAGCLLVPARWSSSGVSACAGVVELLQRCLLCARSCDCGGGGMWVTGAKSERRPSRSRWLRQTHWSGECSEGVAEVQGGDAPTLLPVATAAPVSGGFAPGGHAGPVGSGSDVEWVEGYGSKVGARTAAGQWGRQRDRCGPGRSWSGPALWGAECGIRTRMPFRAEHFECSVSAIPPTRRGKSLATKGPGLPQPAD